jgi:hypothetical protein
MEPSSPYEESSAEVASAAELDSTGAKAIELYQNHLSLLDRIWSYFSQYSALLFVLSCALALSRNVPAVQALPSWLLGAPILLYVVLTAGNRRTIALTLAELQIIKGIAVTKTRYDFRGTRPATILLFHLVLSLLVIVMYATAWILVVRAVP